MIQITPGDSRMRGERWADQRSGSGDRGEMVAEDDPAIRRHVVVAVVESNGRRGAVRVERENLRRNEFAIEAVGDA